MTHGGSDDGPALLTIWSHYKNGPILLNVASVPFDYLDLTIPHTQPPQLDLHIYIDDHLCMSAWGSNLNIQIRFSEVMEHVIRVLIINHKHSFLMFPKNNVGQFSQIPGSVPLRGDWQWPDYTSQPIFCFNLMHQFVFYSSSTLHLTSFPLTLFFWHTPWVIIKMIAQE